MNIANAMQILKTRIQDPGASNADVRFATLDLLEALDQSQQVKPPENYELGTAELRIGPKEEFSEVYGTEESDFATEEQINRARELYESDNIQIYYSPVETSRQGIWVPAWVWLGGEV